ncbi:MAG: protoporphyrinogen oxidase HemJ [Rhizobiales bacterium]|nr:protoporphyrinogen oxidase HemJ [Hyphomicrobiales bacterium]
MYLTLKALHIIAVISWMAGLLYLPRLFVYHAQATPGSEQSETFKVMERRLYKFIMMPAMIGAWVVGIVLAFEGQWFASGWFIAKFILVIALTIMHGLLGHWTTEFSYDRNRHSQKFFRIVNEIPTVLMIVIVILATVKPF